MDAVGGGEGGALRVGQGQAGRGDGFAAFFFRGAFQIQGEEKGGKRPRERHYGNRRAGRPPYPGFPARVFTQFTMETCTAASQLQTWVPTASVMTPPFATR